MHESEIKKTAVFLLEKIEKNHRPANEFVNSYLRMHRYIGANDRRQILKLVWDSVRYKERLNYLYPNLNWEAKLEKLEDVYAYDFSKAPHSIQFEMPEWLLNHIPDYENELPALLESAPVMLRAIAPRDEVQKLLAEEGIETSKTDLSPYGLVVNGRANVIASKTYKQGFVEIQDEGAQMTALEMGIRPYESVLDFCAGAGGKSLIFAQIMENKGEIISYDVSVRSLKELVKRAKRAKISIIKTVYPLFSNKKKFDYVVADAPCSGTGTWRRCPDARWNLTEKQLNNIVKRQSEILDTACSYVKEGKFLGYITCSLTQDEDENQTRDFLKRHSEFKLIKERRFSPAKTKTDGFYMALMQKDGTSY